MAACWGYNTFGFQCNRRILHAFRGIRSAALPLSFSSLKLLHSGWSIDPVAGSQ